MIFVGIPLLGTGTWTGSLMAVVLEIWLLARIGNFTATIAIMLLNHGW